MAETAPLQLGVAIALSEANDVAARFAEDVTLLASVGVQRIRLAIEWPLVQPRAGRIDNARIESYLTFIAAARAAGLAIDAALNDGPTPGWFDDEGGFGDAKTAGRWWPRWVDIVAESLGDEVQGWLPMAQPLRFAKPWKGDTLRYLDALTTTAVGWRDAWRILRGSVPIIGDLGVRDVRPVDESIPARRDARAEDHLRWRMWLRGWRDGVITFPEGGQRHIDDLAGSVDVVGISTVCDAAIDRPLTDEMALGWEDRLGGMLRRTGEDGPDRPVALTLRFPHRSDDDRRQLLESSARALRDARSDGIRLDITWISPGIDTAAGRVDGGLIDRDRNLKPSGAAWLERAPGG